jgi:hypothetical protein
MSIDFFFGNDIFYKLISEKEMYCYERRVPSLYMEASNVFKK